MEKLPFEILVHIANEIVGKHIKLFELVCKRWRDASRARTVLSTYHILTVQHFRQYPMLRDYVGLLELDKSDDLTILKFYPTRTQGHFDPWIDLLIAQPLSKPIFNHRIRLSNNRWSTIVFSFDSLSVVGVDDDYNYTFINRIREARPRLKVIFQFEVGVFPPRYLPKIIDQLNVTRLVDELSLNVVFFICRIITVKVCKITVRPDQMAEIKEKIDANQSKTIFTLLQYPPFTNR